VEAEAAELGAASPIGAENPSSPHTASRLTVQPCHTVARTVRAIEGVRVIEVLPFGKLTAAG
jgi:hypothetical protein